jgi:hypothetical protein
MSSHGAPGDRPSQLEVVEPRMPEYLLAVGWPAVRVHEGLWFGWRGSTMVVTSPVSRS